MVDVHIVMSCLPHGQSVASLLPSASTAVFPEVLIKLAEKGRQLAGEPLESAQSNWMRDLLRIPLLFI